MKFSYIGNQENKDVRISGSYANAAFIQANAAFDAANTSGISTPAVYRAYTGNGTANTFTVTIGTTANTVIVAENGIVQRPITDYNISSTTLTFVTAPAAGVDIQIRELPLVSSNVAGVFAQANASFIQANAAFSLANSLSGGTSTDGVARDFANSAGSYANSAFLQANAAFTAANSGSGATAASSYANSAFLKANSAYDSQNTSGLYANAAFNVANNALDVGGTASSYANAAFLHANAAYAMANSEFNAIAASSYANSAFLKANSAYGSQNTTGTYANSAYTAANTADGKAVTSGSYANSAYTAANTADGKAVTSGSYANSAFSVANIASTNATTATNAASVADGKAVTAGTYANSAYTQANTATTNAATADSKAVTAGSYANSAYTQANTAATDSTAAGSYANSAYTAANTADGKAVTAGSYANSAYGVANSSSSYANAAFIQANAAFTAANTGGSSADAYARSTANAAFLRANAAYDLANSGSGSLVITNDVFTANGSSNTFTLSVVPASANNIIVNIDGVMQLISSFNLASSIVTTSGTPASNAKVDITTITGTVSVKYDSFTANGVSNTFVLSVTPENANNVIVNIDGVIQLKNAYNVITNTIVTSAVPTSNAKIDVITISTVSGTLTIINDTFVANGSSNTFTLSTTPVDANNVIVNINGILQLHTSYNVVSSVVTTTGTPASNAVIDITTLSLVGGSASSDTYARDTANAAFLKANSSYGSQNTTGTYANAAYTAANTADGKAVTAGSYANSAYTQANTATTNAATADDKAVTSGSYANSAYGVANSAALYANGAFLQANGAYNSQNTTGTYANAAFAFANSAGSYANAAFTVANNALPKTGGTITGSLTISTDLVVQGNLSILGNSTTITTSQLEVGDSLIYLANNNYTSDVVDIGIIGHYNNAGNAHTGIIRDPNRKEWIFFQDYTPEVESNNLINIAHPSFAYSNVYGNVFKGNLISNYAIVNGYDVITYTTNAYTQANTGVTNAATADSKAVTAGSYANSAYITANAAFAAANASGGITFTASNNSPGSPTVGDQWYSLTDDVLFEYINDGSSNVWIDITSSALSSQSTPTISTSSGATDWSIVFLTSGI
jgi:hypothetical protein